MRLKAIEATDVFPIRLFSVTDLSDVVVLAGPNGVGKTRLIKAILTAFQSPGNINIRFQIEATNSSERQAWGVNELDTSLAPHALKLQKTLHKNRSRSNWDSSVLHFESDRTIQRIEPYNFSFDYEDPWKENLGWNQTFGGLRTRFQDTVQSLFRKVHSRRGKIADEVDKQLLQGQPSTVTPEAFPDPLLPFKHVFRQLLAPKELVDPDPRRQILNYQVDGEIRPIETLSSGEREVINIVFDFLLRNPTDSIIIFDEPELHLHPELSYKLLQTLRGVGTNNQFIFCTHSPEIITASLENSVIFLSPPRDPPINQAILVREDDQTHDALRLLGQSIGIVALGKKLVLIEGAHSSLDKQVYGAILKNRFPNLVLVPCGGKQTIRSFASIAKNILNQTIWGVDFFMLIDRDILPAGMSVFDFGAPEGRLKVLSRYHIENYFLDEQLLSSIFERMEPIGSWLRSPEQIRIKLREFAQTMASYAAAMTVAEMLRTKVGSMDVMPSECQNKTAKELALMIQTQIGEEQRRVADILLSEKVEALVQEAMDTVSNSLATDGDSWKSLIPGRPILHMFASVARIEPGRLKLLYLQEADLKNSAVFDDLISIFQSFENL